MLCTLSFSPTDQCNMVYLFLNLVKICAVYKNITHIFASSLLTLLLQLHFSIFVFFFFFFQMSDLF